MVTLLVIALMIEIAVIITFLLITVQGLRYW